MLKRKGETMNESVIECLHRRTACGMESPNETDSKTADCDGGSSFRRHQHGSKQRLARLLPSAALSSLRRHHQITGKGLAESELAPC